MAHELLRHLPVRLEVLLFGREILPVEEEELRAVEPHPVGAASQRDVRLLRKLDVRQEQQRLPVTRDRRQAGELRQVAGPLRVGLPPLLVFPDRLLGRVEDDHSFLAVDDDRLRGPVLLRRPLDPDDRRDPQGARRDRGVGRPASDVGGEAEHGALQDLRGVRRGEIVGHDDHRITDRGDRVHGAAGEVFEDPVADLAQVVSPLPQVRILDPVERLQEVLEHLVERPVRGELVFTDRPDRLLDEHRVLEEGQMDREDLVVFGGGVRHAVPYEEDLLPGAGHRPLEGGDLLVHLFAADRRADRPRKDAVQEEPLPDRDPSRGRDPLEDPHLLAAFRHLPTPPRTSRRSAPRSPPRPLPHPSRSRGSGSSCPSAPPASGRP